MGTENITNDAGSINVNIDSLGDSWTSIGNLLEEIKETLKRADAAGKAAVSACGGESTKVGSAINESLVAVNVNEFKRVQERVTNLRSGVRIIHNAYAEEENELVNAINKYKEDYSFPETSA